MALFVAKASHDFIRRLAEEYIEDGMNMNKLADIYASSAGTISNILFRGVSEGIIDEVTSVAIANKAFYSTDNMKKTKLRWKKALALREAIDVEEEIQYVSERLKELHFQIDTYEDYFTDEACAPTKESLETQYSAERNRLNQLKKRLNELKGC